MRITRNWRGQAEPRIWLTIAMERALRSLPAIRSLRSGQEGNALVEFAVIAPVLMMIMTGIFSIGLAFSNQLTLTQAVGAGAQYLQIIRNSTSDPCADTFTAITNAAPNLNSSNIKLTVTINGTTPSQSGNSCSGAQANLLQGVNVTVYATYPCNIAVYGVSFSPSCVLSAQVTEYEY